jgi:hypothetical protein
MRASIRAASESSALSPVVGCLAVLALSASRVKTISAAVTIMPEYTPADRLRKRGQRVASCCSETSAWPVGNTVREHTLRNQ